MVGRSIILSLSGDLCVTRRSVLPLSREERIEGEGPFSTRFFGARFKILKNERPGISRYRQEPGQRSRAPDHSKIEARDSREK